MTLEEYKSLVYEREAQVSPESFGGNEQRYQEWLKSNGTNPQGEKSKVVPE
mgnify:FL=1